MLYYVAWKIIFTLETNYYVFKTINFQLIIHFDYAKN